jgi:hypothetical protein
MDSHQQVVEGEPALEGNHDLSVEYKLLGVELCQSGDEFWEIPC